MAIIDIDGVTFLTSHVFPSRAEWDIGIAALKNTTSSALGLEKLPLIDAM
jgi:hypothetical protein